MGNLDNLAVVQRFIVGCLSKLLGGIMANNTPWNTSHIHGDTIPGRGVRDCGYGDRVKGTHELL
jgi:hypothetical protein